MLTAKGIGPKDKSGRKCFAEWVRQTLRAARRGESTGDPAHKLAAISAAARNSFPTADVVEMSDQIEAGYSGRK
jgi:hypothetical protein